MQTMSPLTARQAITKGMTSLTERLREVMDACAWEHADVMRISGETSSVVSQWLGKGSKEIKSIGKISAALNLAAASGYAPLWIAKGQGPKKLLPPANAATHHLREPAPTYATPEHKLAVLRSLLADVPPDMRGAFADVLAGWARCGGADDRAPALLALLSAQRKRQA